MEAKAQLGAVTLPSGQPKRVKASVELGREVGGETGQLVNLLGTGSGKASLKITLTWE